MKHPGDGSKKMPAETIFLSALMIIVVCVAVAGFLLGK